MICAKGKNIFQKKINEKNFLCKEHFVVSLSNHTYRLLCHSLYRSSFN